MKENFNVRDKKGSIALFVLVGLLFMSGFLIILYGYNVNKSKIAKEQFNSISDIYSHKDGNISAYDRAYTALRKKNKQTLTKTIEDSSVLELDKTYEENLVNYRIYGNINGLGTISKNILNRDDLVVANLDGAGNIEISVNYRIVTEKYIEVKPGTTYRFSGKRTDGTSLSCIVCEYNESKELLSRKLSQFVNTKELTKYIRICFYSENNREKTTIEDNIELQIEEGSVATDYEPYGIYKVPVRVSGNDVEEQTLCIYLSNPLELEDYIDFKLGKVIRNDGTEESLELPEMLAYEDYTKIEVLTDVTPSKIEVEYVGYTL